MKKLIENTYFGEKLNFDKLQPSKEIQLKTKLCKSSKHLQSNDNIINYGRFVETNRTKSKLSKSIETNPFYFYKSKRSSTKHHFKSILDHSLIEDNSNFTEKLDSKTDKVPTIEMSNKNSIHVVTFEKNSNLHESEKFQNFNRRRYKSVDNQELQKLVQAKLNQSPNQIRATVNKWLKDTLPAIVVNDNEIGIDNIPKDIPKIKTNLIKSNNETYFKKEIQQLELCCRELLANTDPMKNKTNYNAVRFYNLLRTLYTSLQYINNKSKTFNCLSMNDENKKDNSIKEKLDNKYSSKITDSDLSSLDAITRSTNNSDKINIKQKNLKLKSAVNLSGQNNQKKLSTENNKHTNVKNVILAKTIEKEISSSQPVLINTEKILIGELLTMPKVEIKSKCIVGVYKNFVEEQYVITGFREISKQDRVKRLQNQILEKNKILCRLVHLTTNSLCKGDETITINNNQQVQTIDVDLNDKPLISNHNVASQTSYSAISDNPKIILDKDEPCETPSWQSDNLSNDDLFYQIENEIMSPIIFEDNVNYMYKEEISKADITNAGSNFEDLSDDSKYTMVKNQNIIQQATTAYCRMPLFLIDYEIIELSKWTAHASRVKVFYNHAIENLMKYNLFTGSILKNSKLNNKNQSEIIQRKYKEILDKENKTVRIFNKNTLPPCGPSTKNVKSTLFNDGEICSKTISVLESNCQEIKDSLENDIPLPENLSNLYERLSKLQKILEGIPNGNITSEIDGFDQLDSSKSNSPEFNSKYDYSYLQYLEKDQCPTSLGDCTENGEVSEFPQQNKLKSNSKLYPNYNGDPNLLKNKNNETNFDDEQSEVSNSLSMLENLIDDFLLKNGLSNSKF